MATKKSPAADWRKSFANIDKAVGEETKRAVTNKDVIRLQRIEEIHEAQIRNPEIKGRGEIAKAFERGRLSGISPAALEEAIRREEIKKAEAFVARQKPLAGRAAAFLAGKLPAAAGKIYPFLFVLGIWATVDNLGWINSAKVNAAKANFEAKIWTKERYEEEVENALDVQEFARSVFEVPGVKESIELIAPGIVTVLDETKRMYTDLAETIHSSTEEQLRAGVFPTLERRIEEAKILQEKKNEFFAEGKEETQEEQNIRERMEIMEERSARFGEIEGLYKNAIVAAREDPVLRRLEGERRAAEAKVRAAPRVEKVLETRKAEEAAASARAFAQSQKLAEATPLEKLQGRPAMQPTEILPGVKRLQAVQPDELVPGVKRDIKGISEEEFKKRLKRK